MSTKEELLFEQVYYKYITGEYDVPRIPADSDVQSVVNMRNTKDSDPTFQISKFTELNYEQLSGAVDSIIDDVDILYRAVDLQSKKILDQLTNSLKEYRGVKYTLNKIKSEADDINAGKTDIDNIRYMYTENFTTLNNINTKTTSIDPDTKYPVVDVEAGQMYIPDNYLNLVDLSHYYGKKLDIKPSHYSGTITGQPKYVGSADAATILDIHDDRRLMYEVQTSGPSEMNLSFTLQLRTDGKKEKINAIALKVDSEVTKGYLRIEYMKDHGWALLPIEYVVAPDAVDDPETTMDETSISSGSPVFKITADKIQIKFENIETSHLKFMFLKQQPDKLIDNTYNLTITDLAVFKSTTHKLSTLISNSTEIKPYGSETPVISTIASSIKGYIPENCFVDVYVAQDKLLPAYYVNSTGDYVDPKSLNASELKLADQTTPQERYVLLSDVKGKTNVSGVAQFNDFEYDWKLIKSFSTDNLKPEAIKLINLQRKDPYDNSISSSRKILFGDPYYTDVLNGEYPQADWPMGVLPNWFLSGCITTTNPDWPIYEDYIDQGLLISGSCWESTPSGFPWNWWDARKERTLRWNDLIYVVPGWSRPDSDLVTPSGIVNISGEISESEINNISNPRPDFYINGIKFYKVYKFEKNSEVVASDINLYTYQTKPVNGSVTNGVNDYYPHNMVWNYNDKYLPYTTTHLQTAAGSGEVYLPLPEGTTYIEDSVRDVYYYNENFYLDQIRHYNVVGQYPSGVLVDMSPIGDDDIYKSQATVSFTYAYNQINNYMSYWDGYIIADEDETKINIIQKKYFGDNIVERVKIVNVATQEAITISDNDNYIYLGDKENLDYTLNRGIYSLRIYCLTDRSGSYPANWWSPNSSEFIEIFGNARIVADVNPMKIVSIETLLYTTTYENDYRCSVITDVDGFQYVVVKEPSKNIIPGYYFDNKRRAYIKNDSHVIRNIGHYKRKYARPSGEILLEEYITGSQVNDIVSGNYFDDSTLEVDYAWNKGKLYEPDFKNTTNGLYRQHSTFGHPINVDETFGINKGHLFYNTAENLPAFYTIEYGLVDRSDSTINKFLYRIDLKSEHESYTPVLDSVKFIINTNLEEL